MKSDCPVLTAKSPPPPEHFAPESLKIAVVSFSHGAHAELAAVTVPNKEAYCKRHGYTGMFPRYDGDYSPYKKFEHVRWLLNDHDAVLWIDCDAMFLNMDLKVERLIDRSGGQRVLTITKDGEDYAGNSGVMLWERCPEALEFLDWTLAPLQANSEKANTPLWDNDFIDTFIRVYPHLCRVLPQRMMNSYLRDEYPVYLYPWSQYGEGDWILHLAGVSPLERRVELAKKWLGKVEVTQEAIDKAYLATWAGPPELKPRIYRTQSEKDAWHATVVENEYRMPDVFAPDDVVVDLGAQIGGAAYRAYRAGSRTIYAFEIDPWHIEAAAVNLGDMKDGVVIYHRAVVRGDEKRAEKYHYDGAWNSFGLFGPEILSSSLDEIIEKAVDPVRFLKIDIEGAEWPVLYTSKLLDRVQQIGGEYHVITAGETPELQGLPPFTPEALAAYLDAQGFDVEINPASDVIGNFYATRRAGAVSLSGSLVTAAMPWTTVHESIELGPAEVAPVPCTHDYPRFNTQCTNCGEKVVEQPAVPGPIARLLAIAEELQALAKELRG